MARISTYAQDTVVSGLDSWIGSDVSNSNATMNFTPDALSLYYIKNGFVDPSRQGLIYTYKAKPGTDIKGVFNFATERTTNVALDGTLTDILVSKLDNNRNDQSVLLEYMIGHDVKIITPERSKAQSYGIYTITSVMEADADYYSLTLTFVSGVTGAVIELDDTVTVSSVAGTSTNAPTPNQIRSSVAAPTDTDGNIGDFWVQTVEVGGDVSTLNWYGPKLIAGWGDATSLLGIDGDAGQNGDSVTAFVDDGTPGEYRLTVTQVTYDADNTPTTLVITDGVDLFGPRGVQGLTGSKVLGGDLEPTTLTGDNGDFYLMTAYPYNFYGPKTANQWTSNGTLFGATGPTGGVGLGGIGIETITGNTPPLGDPTTITVTLNDPTGDTDPVDQVFTIQAGAQGETGVSPELNATSTTTADGVDIQLQESLDSGVTFTNIGDVFSLLNGGDGEDGNRINGVIDRVPLDNEFTEGDFVIATISEETFLYGPQEADGTFPTPVQISGDGISNIALTEDGDGFNEYTITLTSGDTYTFRANDGATGEDGTAVLSGTEVPTDNIPADSVLGDFYLQTISPTSRFIFGPKVVTTLTNNFGWGDGTQLVGEGRFLIATATSQDAGVGQGVIVPGTDDEGNATYISYVKVVSEGTFTLTTDFTIANGWAIVGGGDADIAAMLENTQDGEGYAFYVLTLAQFNQAEQDAIDAGEELPRAFWLITDDFTESTQGVTSVTAGAGLDGGVITTSGTIAVDFTEVATAAQGVIAEAALPRAGGTMGGDIVFAGTQVFPEDDQFVDQPALETFISDKPTFLTNIGGQEILTFPTPTLTTDQRAVTFSETDGALTALFSTTGLGGGDQFADQTALETFITDDAAFRTAIGTTTIYFQSTTDATLRTAEVGEMVFVSQTSAYGNVYERINSSGTFNNASGFGGSSWVLVYDNQVQRDGAAAGALALPSAGGTATGAIAFNATDQVFDARRVNFGQVTDNDGTGLSGDDTILFDDVSGTTNIKVELQNLPFLGTGVGDVGTHIDGLASKATPLGTDLLLIADKADSDNEKQILVNSLPYLEDGYIPLPTVGTAGQFVAVNADGDGYEVKEVDVEDELPTPTVGNAGDLVTVNVAGDYILETPTFANGEVLRTFGITVGTTAQAVTGSHAHFNRIAENNWTITINLLQANAIGGLIENDVLSITISDVEYRWTLGSAFTGPTTITFSASTLNTDIVSVPTGSDVFRFNFIANGFSGDGNVVLTSDINGRIELDAEGTVLPLPTNAGEIFEQGQQYIFSNRIYFRRGADYTLIQGDASQDPRAGDNDTEWIEITSGELSNTNVVEVTADSAGLTPTVWQFRPGGQLLGTANRVIPDNAPNEEYVNKGYVDGRRIVPTPVAANVGLVPTVNAAGVYVLQAAGSTPTQGSLLPATHDFGDEFYLDTEQPFASPFAGTLTFTDYGLDNGNNPLSPTNTIWSGDSTVGYYNVQISGNRTTVSPQLGDATTNVEVWHRTGTGPWALFGTTQISDDNGNASRIRFNSIGLTDAFVDGIAIGDEVGFATNTGAVVGWYKSNGTDWILIGAL